MACGLHASYEAEGWVNSGAEPMLTVSDFSPSLAHTSDVLKANGNRFFGWIMPTLKTSDFVVLQTVGLDASVVRPTLSVYLTAAT